MITTINEWKKMNEGGGAGITFKTLDAVQVDAEYILNANGLRMISSSVIPFETFSALGYDDGRASVQAEGLFNSVEHFNKLTADDFMDITFGELYYMNGTETERILGVEIDENNESTTIREYLNQDSENSFNISISVGINYDKMHFGGWSRGTFDEGDLIFTNGDCDYSGDGYGIYIDNKLNIKNDFDVTTKIAPDFSATEAFVEWFKYEYDNTDDEYFDEESDY